LIKGNDCLFYINVKPRAKINSVTISNGNQITVNVISSAFAGAANKSVINILADIINVPKNTIHIVGGNKSRFKKLHISNINDEEILKLIKSHNTAKNPSNNLYQ